MNIKPRSIFKYALFLTVIAMLIGILPGRVATAQTPSFTFKPSADAYVIQTSPSTNYGKSTSLRVDNSPITHSYLLFSVSGLNGAIQSAKLRMYVNSTSGGGYYSVQAESNNSWTETAITYNNAPTPGSVIKKSTRFSRSVWAEVDVTSYVKSQDTYTFVITTTGNTNANLASRESKKSPQLVITTSSSTGSTPTTIPPTATKAPTQVPTTIPPTATKAPTQGPTTIPPTATKAPTQAPTTIPPTATTAPTQNPTNPASTPTLTNTPVPTLPTPTASPTVVSASRPVNIYAVDRVLNNADYAKLASWGINTAIVDLSISASSSSLLARINAAAAVGIDTVIWPDQGGDVSGCGWETPFNSPQSGDYIWRVKPMLDILGNNPHVIGIVIAHESMWNQGTCLTKISDMATVKTQIHNYIDNTVHRDASYKPFKVWNYIDNISDMPNITDYSGPADIGKIMDVAVTWQHCAGNAESSCDSGSYSALSKINGDRAKINSAGLDGKVQLVFIVQTFTTSGSYSTKFTLSQLEGYSCEFLGTRALDGFGFYTWDAGWWPDLHSWTDLQPAVSFLNSTCR
jgi:hypothetical protein